MANNQTFKERLISFISSLGMSVHAFEATCGFANGAIRNMRNGVKQDKIDTILEKFPQLNKSWLLAGEGEMLKTVDCTNNISVSNSTQIGSNTINNGSDMGDRIATMLELLYKKVTEIERTQQDDISKGLEMQQQMLNIIADISKKN